MNYQNTICDTFRYHIKRGNQVIHRGVTNDLERRHREHKRRYGKDVTIVQIGKITTRECGLKWEREGGLKRPPRDRSCSCGEFPWGTAALIFLGVVAFAK